MANTKDKLVAYKPVSSTQNVEAPSKIDTPQYPDQGVAFAGYSKKYIGNGQYKLFRQEFKSSGTRFGWVASDGELSLTINSEANTKNFYITDIVIEGFSDIACYYALGSMTGIGSTAPVLFRLMCAAGNTIHQQILHFTVPLPFLTTTIFIQPLGLTTGTPLAVTGRCYIEYFGFTEEKI